MHVLVLDPATVNFGAILLHDGVIVQHGLFNLKNLITDQTAKAERIAAMANIVLTKVWTWHCFYPIDTLIIERQNQVNGYASDNAFLFVALLAVFEAVYPYVNRFVVTPQQLKSHFGFPKGASHYKLKKETIDRFSYLVPPDILNQYNKKDDIIDCALLYEFCKQTGVLYLTQDFAATTSFEIDRQFEVEVLDE